ncbi:hypothetical protein Droror1_Dr00020158 [Drosera rotundifolia]
MLTNDFSDSSDFSDSFNSSDLSRSSDSCDSSTLLSSLSAFYESPLIGAYPTATAAGNLPKTPIFTLFPLSSFSTPQFPNSLQRFRLQRQLRRREVGFGVRNHVDLGSSSPKRIDSDWLTPFKKNFYLDPKNSGLKHAQKPQPWFLFGLLDQCQDSDYKSTLQVQDDLEKGVAGAFPIPSDNAGKEEIIAALVANVEAMLKLTGKLLP